MGLLLFSSFFSFFSGLQGFWWPLYLFSVLMELDKTDSFLTLAAFFCDSSDSLLD